MRAPTQSVARTSTAGGGAPHMWNVRGGRATGVSGGTGAVGMRIVRPSVRGLDGTRRAERRRERERESGVSSGRARLRCATRRAMWCDPTRDVV
eukprot:7107633-Prymnesium_polylepis.1